MNYMSNENYRHELQELHKLHEVNELEYELH